MVRGWNADGTQMERGWIADLTFECPISYTLRKSKTSAEPLPVWLRQAAGDWIAASGGTNGNPAQGKVNKITPDGRAYASCKDRGCKVSWLFKATIQGPTDDGLGEWVNIDISQKGVHGGAPSTSMTQTAMQRANAEAYAHLNPTRALAHMVKDGVTPAGLPSNRALRTARASELAPDRSARSGTGGLASVWRQVLADKATATADWDALPVQQFAYRRATFDGCDDWLSLRHLPESLGLQDLSVEGAAIMVSKAMVAIVKAYIDGGGAVGSKKGSGLADLTFKVTIDGYGLMHMVLGDQHIDAHTRLPASSSITLSLGWGPKDNIYTWLVLMCSTVNFYRNLGINLVPFFAAFTWDGTLGGHNCHRVLMPQTPLGRDIWHVARGIKKWSFETSGGKDWNEYVIGCVQFSGTQLSTKVLFSVHWTQVLCDLVFQGKHRLVELIKKELLEWDHAKQLWTADWYAGADSPYPPGHTNMTIFQSLERNNRSFKTAMPENIAHQNIQESTDRLEDAVTALQVQRGFLRKAEAAVMLGLPLLQVETQKDVK